MERVVYLLLFVTPVMVRRRKHRVGYEPLRERLPATSIGGALAAQGLINVDDVVKGRVSLSDAYPVVEKSSGLFVPSMPATTACFRVKDGAASIDERLAELEGRVVCVPSACRDKAEPADSVQGVIEFLSDELGVPLYTLVKPIIGEPIICRETSKVYGTNLMICERVRIPGFWRDSVAMSIAYRRAEDAMLYSYEAIHVKLWWGVATLNDNTVDELKEGVSVTIGGGRGRGFGLGVIVAAEIECKGTDVRDWLMLWSPLPLTRETAKIVDRVAPDVRVMFSSWGREGPRASIPSLAPGVLVKPRDDVNLDLCSARFEGLIPPRGSAESCSSGLPQSVVLASRVLEGLVKRAEKLAREVYGEEVMTL